MRSIFDRIRNAEKEDTWWILLSPTFWKEVFQFTVYCHKKYDTYEDVPDSYDEYVKQKQAGGSVHGVDPPHQP